MIYTLTITFYGFDGIRRTFRNDVQAMLTCHSSLYKRLNLK